MKKIFALLLCVLSLYSHERDISAKYKISYGVLGSLGEAKASVKIKKDGSYTISIDARATGMAKLLSLGKKESYISQGIYKDGLFRPFVYIKQAQNLIKKRIDTYTFDYSKRVISKHRIAEKQEGDIWKKYESNSTVEFFANNDILSLFFNIKEYVKDFVGPKKYELKALGAKNDTGKIDIVIPASGQRAEMSAVLGENYTNLAKVYIYQDIFSSKNGELWVSIDDSGLCDKAVLKDVLLFGDIVGEVVED